MINAYDKNRNYVRTLTLSAILTALALILSLIEQAIPLPLAVPGIKLGLANIVTVFALYTLGPLPALGIVIVRCLLGSVFAGAISGFIFSISGGLLAWAVMLVLMQSRHLSPIGVCIGGAGAHSIGQILAAMKVLGSTAPLAYLPVLLFVSILTGLVTGIVSWLVLGFLSGVTRFRDSRTAVPIPRAEEENAPRALGEAEKAQEQTVDDVIASVDRVLNEPPLEEAAGWAAGPEDAARPGPDHSGAAEFDETETDDYADIAEFLSEADDIGEAAQTPEKMPDPSESNETFEDILERITRSVSASKPADPVIRAEVPEAPAIQNEEPEAQAEEAVQAGPGRWARLRAELGPFIRQRGDDIVFVATLAGKKAAALWRKFIALFRAKAKDDDKSSPGAEPAPAGRKKNIFRRFKERFDEWYYEDEPEAPAPPPEGEEEDTGYEEDEYDRK